MINKYGTLDLRGVVKVEKRFHNEVKKIIIGNTVEKIGIQTFRGCHNLKEIKFEEECKLKEITECCFAHCTKIRIIDLPESIKLINHNSFYGCRFESIILRGVKIIENNNFYKHYITKLYISDSIEHISNNAFYTNEDDYNINPNIKIYVKIEFQDLMRIIFPKAQFVDDWLNEGYVLK